MFENTANAIAVLQAMLRGYVVEILGDKYAYDAETHKIGILNKIGEENYIAFVEINLNRFLSMCEQIEPAKILDILSVLRYSAMQEIPAPAAAERTDGHRFN